MFALMNRCSGWLSLYATRSAIALSAMNTMSSSTCQRTFRFGEGGGPIFTYMVSGSMS